MYICASYDQKSSFFFGHGVEINCIYQREMIIIQVICQIQNNYVCLGLNLRGTF